MATKVQMPKLSDTMEEGVILKWRYKEGDKVSQGEILVEIESDKADMELEAYDSGVLRKIFVKEGDKAPIGAPIAIIAEADEDIEALLKDDGGAKSSAAEKKEEKPAQKKEEEAAKPEPSPSSAQEPPPRQAQQAPTPAPASASSGRVKASPLARKLASDKGLNLDAIQGSGPGGRIIKRDVDSARPAAVAAPDTSQTRPSKDVALSPIRKTIAKRMTESKQQVPHFYVTIEVDMDPAISLREQLNSQEGVKISFTDILVKACARTLMNHPQVNATYLGDSMRQHGHAHISIAVALDDGLVTPVLRHCEQKSIPLINAELRDLVDRARKRKLKPEEYSGGTFTISNLGMFGVEDFVAIVNPPEGAILAVGSIMEKPVVRKGSIVVGHTMKLTLSSDHRIIDGAVAARFLQELQHTLEHPALLLL